MPYEVETVSIQDIFKICLNTSTDSSVQWLQFRICIESFLLKKYLKKVSINILSIVVFIWKKLKQYYMFLFFCDPVQKTVE